MFGELVLKMKTLPSSQWGLVATIPFRPLAFGGGVREGIGGECRRIERHDG